MGVFAVIGIVIIGAAALGRIERPWLLAMFGLLIFGFAVADDRAKERTPPACVMPLDKMDQMK